MPFSSTRKTLETGHCTVSELYRDKLYYFINITLVTVVVAVAVKWGQTRSFPLLSMMQLQMWQQRPLLPYHVQSLGLSNAVAAIRRLISGPDTEILRHEKQCTEI